MHAPQYLLFDDDIEYIWLAVFSYEHEFTHLLPSGTNVNEVEHYLHITSPLVLAQFMQFGITVVHWMHVLFAEDRGSK